MTSKPEIAKQKLEPILNDVGQAIVSPQIPLESTNYADPNTLSNIWQMALPHFNGVRHLISS